jgi:hypothetical protein
MSRGYSRDAAEGIVERYADQVRSDMQTSNQLKEANDAKEKENSPTQQEGAIPPQA